MLRLKLKQILLLLVSTVSIVGYASSHHHSEAEFVAEKITDSLYFLVGGDGGNIAVLVGDDGLLVVDNGYKHRSKALKKALHALGGENSLEYIVNTHWHGDHAEGNLALGHGVSIVAHNNVRNRLQQANEIKLFGMKSEPYPEHALPNISYSKQMNLYVNDEELSLMHVGRGHTDGDSVVFFKNANAVHMGDLFFNESFPFVDVDNQGNVLSVINSLESLLEYINDDAIVIPGHGPLATKAKLIDFLAMLKGTAEEVKAMQAQGLSLKDMQEKGLSEKWSAWGNAVFSEELWIQLIAASLK